MGGGGGGGSGGGGGGGFTVGVLVQPPLRPNVTKCKVEFAGPSSPELAHGKSM